MTDVGDIARHLWATLGLKWTPDPEAAKKMRAKEVVKTPYGKGELEFDDRIYVEGPQWLIYRENGTTLKLHQHGGRPFILYETPPADKQKIGLRLIKCGTIGFQLFGSGMGGVVPEAVSFNKTYLDSLDDAVDFFVAFIEDE